MKCSLLFNYGHDSARTHFSWQPCPIPAAITEYRAAGGMGPVENVRKRRKKRACLAFSSTVFSSQSVSQSVASHQARISPPPTSLLSRQTVTDALSYKAIIYQPPRLFNPRCSTLQRQGKGSECDRSLKSEIATSVQHGHCIQALGLK